MILVKGEDRRLVVVSNRLPYCRKVDGAGKSSWHKAAGGLVTAIEPIITSAGGLWLGWDGHPQEAKPENFELVDPKGSKYKIGCIPITAAEQKAYYTGFSNSTLWALFHYFFEKCEIDYKDWEAYKKINQRFAFYIDRNTQDDDLVWIQDYHLFLVPYYLRKLRPQQQIHFFLHIPFPHTDIFSILPWSRSIIESLLCCDTVGFHHKQYLKNFREAVDKYRQETGAKETPTRTFSNFISIDYEIFDATSRKASVIERKEKIREQFATPKIILGIDRIDYSKGIKERLLALESLFQLFPELKEKFVYYQLAVPSREDVESYRALKKEIDEIVGRIVGEYSANAWSPIHYHHGSVNFEELIALYSAADIALVTPLRDGMNLVCKEYIASHSDEDGVLILSKFAGASAEITECLTVNPYSIEEIRDAIYRALHMPREERRKRMAAMRRTVSAHPIQSWLQKCLEEFEK